MAKKHVNITQVCSEIFAGGDAPKDRMSTQPTPEYKVPVYSNGEDNDGLYGYTDFARVTSPSITVSARGTIGYTSIRNEPFVPIVRLITITPIPEIVDIRYLYYVIKNYNFKGSGTSIPQLTVPMLKTYKFPLPSLDEQRSIAAVLDKVSGLIAKRREQLDKLDELVKARFVEMFGDPLCNTKNWSCLELTKACKAILGGGTPSKSHPEYFMGTIPWVSPKDMKQTIINDSIDHITEEAIANSTTNLIPRNSVLMVIRSGILKHTLPVAINNVPVTINQDMKAFVPDNAISTEFLIYYFKAIEPDVLAGVRGVTADNIDFKAFQKRKIIVPPIDLQRQFVIFVKRINISKLTIQQSLDKLEVLKKALMQQYFG